MIFADKLVRLRKKSGMSQEELAERMNVSRQSVSKWESAQSVPDLEKILRLGELFGVTTDYLLKDEIEDEEFVGKDTSECNRKITLAEANEFLELRKRLRGVLLWRRSSISPRLRSLLYSAARRRCPSRRSQRTPPLCSEWRCCW